MFKNTHIWIWNYVKQSLKRARRFANKPVYIMFTIVDHFEPRWGKVNTEKELERVDKWISKYEPVVRHHRDSDGKIPQYTFFYPIDEYTPQAFDKTAQFCGKGFGEMEVHLHHDNDTEDSLRKKLEHAKDVFSKRGLLGRERTTGAIKYGFVHGNWSLGNSRKDGRWCGVNNELAVLKETGCYADFTLPSAPSETQTRKINSIYYAKDTGFPKPQNSGVDVEAGKAPEKDLMIIQGPLVLNWRRRKFRLFPRIENSGISFNNPPTEDRVDLWIDQRISVKGRPDWIFVKVYTHGLQDDNLKDEYFDKLDKMFDYLEKRYNNGLDYKLHYVTAREMYNIVKAAEAGKDGSPDAYRDFELERRRVIARAPKAPEAISN